MILNLYNQGYSYSAIADRMKKSPFTIRSVIRRFSNLETVLGAPRGGRLKKLRVRKKREIIVKKNPQQHIVGNCSNHKQQF